MNTDNDFKTFFSRTTQSKLKSGVVKNIFVAAVTNNKKKSAVILNNMTDEMMTCLEKSNRNLEAVKKLKISDAKFVNSLLKFINGLRGKFYKVID